MKNEKIIRIKQMCALLANEFIENNEILLCDIVLNLGVLYEVEQNHRRYPKEFIETADKARKLLV